MEAGGTRPLFAYRVNNEIGTNRIDNMDEKRKSLLKGYKITFAALAIGMSLLYGGIAVHHYIVHSRAVAIAKRLGVAQSLEKALTKLDPKAFRQDGIIQSYEIQFEQSGFTPANWLEVDLEINQNPDWSINAQIKYDTLKDEYEIGPMTISQKLSKLLKSN